MGASAFVAPFVSLGDFEQARSCLSCKGRNTAMIDKLVFAVKRIGLYFWWRWGKQYMTLPDGSKALARLDHRSSWYIAGLFAAL